MGKNNVVGFFYLTSSTKTYSRRYQTQSQDFVKGHNIASLRCHYENNYCIWNPVEIWDWREVPYIKVFSGFLWLRWGQGGDHWRAEVLCTTGLLLFCLVWLQHCITIELVFTLSHRVCLSDDLFKTNCILFVLWLWTNIISCWGCYRCLMCLLCVIVCWRWCWSRLCQIWGTLRVCLCTMCLLCFASSDCSRTSYLLRALTIKHYGVRRWGMDWYILTLTIDFITHTLLFQIKKFKKLEEIQNEDVYTAHKSNLAFKSVSKNNCIWKQIIKTVDAHSKKSAFNQISNNRMRFGLSL